MKAYGVNYRMFKAGEEKEIIIPANNKEQAYCKAIFHMIPAREGEMPYSAWVSNVTYNNGNYRRFNTCEGLPY